MKASHLELLGYGETLNHLVNVTHWMEFPDYPKSGALHEMTLDEKTKDFARRFIDENEDLLKRMTNR